MDRARSAWSCPEAGSTAPADCRRSGRREAAASCRHPRRQPSEACRTPRFVATASTTSSESTRSARCWRSSPGCVRKRSYKKLAWFGVIRALARVSLLAHTCSRPCQEATVVRTGSAHDEEVRDGGQALEEEDGWQGRCATRHHTPADRPAPAHRDPRRAAQAFGETARTPGRWNQARTSRDAEEARVVVTSPTEGREIPDRTTKNPRQKDEKGEEP